MIKKIFIATLISALFLASCQQNTKKEEGKDQTENSATSTDEIVKDSIMNKDGSKLNMVFNNTKNTAVVTLNGTAIELEGQKPASGIWYKNDHYELRGKGKDIELTKDGTSIFKHKEDILESTVIDEDGTKLHMSFNNDANTATFLLNGETIALKGDTTGSGIQYRNQNYVYIEHQGNMELKKDGKVVFEIKK